MATPATPAMMALPANVGLLAGDASTNRKFYTITASLREIYDDNVNTTNIKPQASFETSLSPSILVDFPMQDSDFSARYTFDMTYYSTGPNTGGGNGGGGGGGPSVEYTHEFVAQYMHSFSDRFNFNLAEQFRYFTEPSLFESTGTNYQNGPYVSNTLNGVLTAQWTPLWGTTISYANTIIKYDNAAVALAQNSIENTGSPTLSFAVAPKINVSFGGIVDNITYDSASRGYTNYTAFVGGVWQALPSLSVTGRGGGSYTDTSQGQSQGQGQGQGQGLISPYAALSIDWTLGARSSLSFSYAHEITPTGQAGADAQTSDRLSANVRYDITPRLSSHLQGILTDATISNQLATSATGTGSSANEYDYALDTGLTYHYNSFLDFDSGITLSGVASEISSTDYTRDEFYLGMRGTY